MASGRLRIEYQPLAKIQRAPRNPREHDLPALAAAFERFGYVSPVILDERSGRLVAGHGRLDALAQLKRKGGKLPEGMEQQGRDWLVPVLRGKSFKDSREAEAYLLADNRLGQLGGWREAALGRMLRDMAKRREGLKGTGFGDRDIGKLVRDLGDRRREGDVEEVPALPKRAVTKLGDMWSLGDHRIYCADSSKVENLKTALGGKPADMIATDPPYAIYGSSTGVSAEITDDKMVRPFFEKLFQNGEEVLPMFAHAYVFCDWRSWASVWEGAKTSRLVCRNLLVWDKMSSGLGFNYANTYELVGFFVKLQQRTALRGGNATGQRGVPRPNLIRLARVPSKQKEHNAAKPVALIAEFVRNSSHQGATVLDPFLGSGTTIVACEQLGRRGVGLEIEPRFCDVAVERLQKLTGKKAERKAMA